MKTLGRILIILAVFTLIMGGLYLAVNSASPGSANSQQFNRPDEDRPAFEGGQPLLFENGERPDFPLGDRGEFGEGGFGGFGWIFGAIKNIGIVAIVVLFIVLPKGWLKRRRAVQIVRS